MPGRFPERSPGKKREDRSNDRFSREGEGEEAGMAVNKKTDLGWTNSEDGEPEDGEA